MRRPQIPHRTRGSSRAWPSRGAPRGQDAWRSRRDCVRGCPSCARTSPIVVAESMRAETEAVRNFKHRDALEDGRGGSTLHHVADMNDGRARRGSLPPSNGCCDVRESSQDTPVGQEARVQVVQMQDRDQPDLRVGPCRERQEERHGRNESSDCAHAPSVSHLRLQAGGNARNCGGWPESSIQHARCFNQFLLLLKWNRFRDCRLGELGNKLRTALAHMHSSWHGNP